MQQTAAQSGHQWITLALLMSLTALLAAVSLGLLTDSREFRAEIKADLREPEFWIRGPREAALAMAWGLGQPDGKRGEGERTPAVACC